MKNNKDFLRQFFKNQNIFKQDRIKETEKKSVDIDNSKFISNKHINLKALFKNIEEEKKKIKLINKEVIQYKKNLKSNDINKQTTTQIIKSKDTKNNKQQDKKKKLSKNIYYKQINLLKAFQTTLTIHNTHNTDKTHVLHKLKSFTNLRFCKSSPLSSRK